MYLCNFSTNCILLCSVWLRWVCSIYAARDRSKFSAFPFEFTFAMWMQKKQIVVVVFDSFTGGFVRSYKIVELDFFHIGYVRKITWKCSISAYTSPSLLLKNFLRWHALTTRKHTQNRHTRDDGSAHAIIDSNNNTQRNNQTAQTLLIIDECCHSVTHSTFAFNSIINTIFFSPFFFCLFLFCNSTVLYFSFLYFFFFTHSSNGF